MRSMFLLLHIFILVGGPISKDQGHFLLGRDCPAVGDLPVVVTLARMDVFRSVQCNVVLFYFPT